MNSNLRSPNDPQFYGNTTEAAFVVVGSYNRQMAHQENVKNVLVYRWPNDHGVSFLVDANMVFTTFDQLNRYKRNIYDTSVYPKYPIEEFRLASDKNTLIPDGKFPFLHLILQGKETFILMQDTETEITKENWRDFLGQKAPGYESLPPGGKVIATVEYE